MDPAPLMAADWLYRTGPRRRGAAAGRAPTDGWGRRTRTPGAVCRAQPHPEDSAHGRATALLANLVQIAAGSRRHAVGAASSARPLRCHVRGRSRPASHLPASGCGAPAPNRLPTPLAATACPCQAGSRSRRAPAPRGSAVRRRFPSAPAFSWGRGAGRAANLPGESACLRLDRLRQRLDQPAELLLSADQGWSQHDRAVDPTREDSVVDTAAHDPAC